MTQRDKKALTNAAMRSIIVAKRQTNDAATRKRGEEMKHSILFEDVETGKIIAISSQIFDDKKELHVAVNDESTCDYHERKIKVYQHEEHDRQH